MPRQKNETLTIRTTTEIKDLLRQAAEREQRSLATMIEAQALGMVAWRKEQGTVGDTTAVFLDSAFENDVVKSNLAAILDQHGIKQVRRL